MQTKSITIEIYGENEALLAFALQDALDSIERGRNIGCDLSPRQGFSFYIKQINDKPLLN